MHSSPFLCWGYALYPVTSGFIREELPSSLAFEVDRNEAWSSLYEFRVKDTSGRQP
jgi:hypothetical protein